MLMSPVLLPPPLPGRERRFPYGGRGVSSGTHMATLNAYFMNSHAGCINPAPAEPPPSSA
jgi:hypothetical protein